MVDADTETGNGNNGAPGVLAGVKVMDLCWFGAGPIATNALANMGADVIRIETEKRPDGLRIGGPRPPDTTSLNLSGYYNNYNDDKRSVTIDLTTERGHELAIELVKWADIFATNMTNRAVAQMGMTWDTVKAANPGIIGFYEPMQGLTGPHSEFLGFGAILSTVCGVNYLAGYEKNRPIGVGTNYPDYVLNPIQAAIGILAALRHKRRTGEGQLIDMSQLESSVAGLAGPLFAYDNAGIEHERTGNRVGFAAPHGAFPVAGEDRWIVIACLDGEQWRRLAEVCGHAEWAEDARFATLEARKANEDALEALIAEWTAERDGPAAMAQLQAAGIPAGIVQTASEVLADEHMVEREYFAYPEHAEAGRRAYDGPGWRMSKTPIRVGSAAPLLGEHTNEICTEVLGLSADEIANLVVEKVLF